MENKQPEGLYFYLASDDEFKYLHAEVYCGDFFICLIDTDKGDFTVSFYNDAKINWNMESVSFTLDEFMIILEKAKKELLKFYNGINDPL
ncbi:hypothetical protein [Hymenobacter ruber]